MAKRKALPSPLTHLAEKVRGLDAVFCCGGSVSLERPLHLGFGGQRGTRIDPAHPDRSARRLKKECKPAVFGVGGETHEDERVRQGGQRLADGGALTVDDSFLMETGILEHVRETLCPGADVVPEAELHALNIYPRGGHFVGHKDTPRDPRCFGTLVVCLPIPFGGGRLIARHGSAQVWDWAFRTSYRAGVDSTELRWAAFYGDVDHEVEPVTSGLRATLTWLLRWPESEAPRRTEPAAGVEDLEAAFRAALEDKSFLPEGGTLGVPCQHLYGETKGFLQPAASMPAAAAARLKGADRHVAVAAMGAGLEARYRPYLHEDCAETAWRLSRSPTTKEAKIFGRRRLGATKLNDTLPIEHEISWDTKDDVTWILDPAWKAYQRKKTQTRSAEPATEWLGHTEYSATDYFGNEGSYLSFYASAALLITVPPFGQRG